MIKVISFLGDCSGSVIAQGLEECPIREVWTRTVHGSSISDLTQSQPRLETILDLKRGKGLRNTYS